MQTSPSLRRLTLPALLLGSAILPQQALADTHVWIGPAGGNWSVPGNWTGGVPTSGEAGANGTVVQFGSNTSSVCNIAGLTVDQIRFTGTNNQIGGTQTLSLSGVNAQTNILDEAGGNTILSTLPITLVGGSTIFIQVNTGILNLAGNIGGTQGIRVISNGANGVTLSGASNTYTGGTSVAIGTLRLNSNGFSTAVVGNITLGTGNGAGAALVLLQAQEIGDSSVVTVEADGTFNSNNLADTIGSLIVKRGAVTLGTGPLTVNGTTSLAGGTISGTGLGILNLKGNVTATSGVSTTLISAPVSLNGARTITVNPGTAQPELQISSVISNGPATSTLIKDGNGTLHLTTGTASTYTGGTTVKAGKITLNGASSSVIPPGLVTIGDGTGAAGTASIVLQQFQEVSDTATITVLSDGLFDSAGFNEIIGALQVTQGSVTHGAGDLTVTGATTIAGGSVNFTSGTLITGGTTALSGGAIMGGSGSYKPGGDITAAASGATGSLIGSNIVLATSRNITVNGSGSGATPELTILGVISETAPSGITKQGTGTLKLESNASNTFSGALTINKGKAQFKANSGRTVQSSLVIGNNSDPAGSATVQNLIQNNILSTIPVTINASGVLDLNDFTDSIGSLVGTGTISLPTTNSVLNSNSNDSNSIFGGSITGPGTFRKAGNGTLGLTKAPTAHTGTLRINSGTLSLDYATGAAGSATIQVGDSTGVAGSAVLSVGGSGRIVSPTDISVFLDGTLLLNNNTASAKHVSVTSGSITLGTGKLSTNTLAMVGGLIGPNTGTLALGGNVTTGASASTAAISALIALDATPEITVNDGAAATDLLLTGVISDGTNGSRGLRKVGAGTMRFNGSFNNYTGTTEIASGPYELQATSSVTIPGALVIGNDSDAPGSAVVKDINALNIALTSPVTIRGSGKLDLNNFQDRAGSLSGTGQFVQGSNVLTLGGADSSATFAGVVTGSGTTNKLGAGTQTFTGNNSTYTGNTNINVGKIVANSTQAGSYFLAAGTAFGGEGLIAGNVTSNAGGTTYAPGNPTYPSIQQVSGSVNITGGKYSVRLDDTTFVRASMARVNGNLNITACSLEVIRGLTVASKPQIIATYGSLTGAFTSIPAGYTVNYAFSDGISSNHIAITPPKVPDLAVLEGSKPIADGGSAKSFGTVTLKKSKTVTYTLRNTGEQTLKNIVVTAPGKNAKEFKVTKPSKNSLAPGKTVTFKVTFKPTAAGNRVAALKITSNDTDENPYDIKLSGKGKKPKKKSGSLDTLLAGLVDAKHGNSNNHKAATTKPSAKASSTPTGEPFTTSIGGRKYNTLALGKSTLAPGTRVLIEVSPNLLDWYSGADHTTVLTDNKRVIEIRDNTPVTADRKRFIRVRFLND